MLSIPRLALYVIVPALGLAGCAQPTTLANAVPPGQITTGSIDPKPAKGPDTEQRVQALTDANFSFLVPGTPADVYVMVARGAMSCWFSPAGPLRRSHVFTADVDPPARGGAALISLHEKDLKGGEQRGARAYQVAMTTAPVGTQVAIATPKMAPEIAEAMKVDVQIWARGKQSCEVSTLLAPTPVASKPATPSKSKEKAAKATR
jgi:hypothetical protein